MSRRALVLATVFAMVGGVPAAATVPDLSPPCVAPGYAFETIDHPGAPATTFVTSIAENGDIVGAFADAGGRFHGFVRHGATGAFADIDVPGARDTYALGINAKGAVSGTFVDATGAQHGFVRDDHGFRTIDIPGAVSTSGATSEFGTGLGTAVGTIRDDGTVVGAWGDAAGASHGFLLPPHRRHVTFDAPGASIAADPVFATEGGTAAIRANDRGDIVGSFAPATRSSLSPVDRRAFLRRAATWTTLLPPGAFTSQAFALTEDGVVGGVAFGIDGINGYGWLWCEGTFRRIDPAPLLLLSTVADISESGVLIGETVTPDLKTHGYIARPLR